MRVGVGISAELDPFLPSNRGVGATSEVRARFAGRIEGASRESRALPIALALDGVIVATSSTREQGGESLYFSFLIPEEVAEQARSEIEIFALRPDDGAIVLERVSVAADRSYRLEANGDIETITSSDGSVFIMDPEHFRGELALLDPIQPIHRAELFGWVSDLEGSLPTAILVFRAGRFLAATSPRSRSEVRMERYLLGEHSEAGFSLSLPFSAAKADLRIFALSETQRFTELELRNRVRPTDDFIGPYPLDGSSSAIQ